MSVLLNNGGCSLVQNSTSAPIVHQSAAVWRAAWYGISGSQRLCEMYTGPLGLMLPTRCAASRLLNGSLEINALRSVLNQNSRWRNA